MMEPATPVARGRPGTLLLTLSATGLVLGPMRFDGYLVTTLLLGYRLHRRGRPYAAAALWSIGSAIKWFPAFLLAAQEVKRFIADRDRAQWRRSALVFGAVALLLNGPFLLAGWWKHGNLDAWWYTYKYHAERPLSADTLLGVAELWLGPMPWQRFAADWSLALMAAAVLVKPALPLARKVVLVAIAALIFNRIYSPQFNLWFYPFVVLVMLASPATRMKRLLVLYVILDVSNVLIYPFIFTLALKELGQFGPYLAAQRAGTWTVVWSCCIVLRAAILLLLAREMLFSRRASDPWHPAPVSPPSAIHIVCWKAWLNRLQLPLLLTVAVICLQSAWTLRAMADLPRYSDEYYHVRQIQRFCAGKHRLDHGITMFPGYHVLSAAIAKLTGDCSIQSLRTFNVLAGLLVTALAFFILKSLRSRRPLARSMAFHFLPILFPYQYVAFTDVSALVPALLTVYLMLRKHWSSAGIIGTLGIAMRQTNVALPLFVAMVAFLDHDKTGPLLDWLLSYLSKTWSSLIGLFAFGAFVWVNQGVAIGDRVSHQPGFHVANVFFVLFLAFVVSLPVNLENLWQRRDRCLSLRFLALLTASAVLYAFWFTIDHPYNAQASFLRNALLSWVVSGPFTKALFFIPVAAGVAAIATTSLSRRSFWVLIPITIALLVPESLVEHRYGILPLSLWLLLRRDASAVAEALAVLTNAGISALFMVLISGGVWSL